MTEEQFQAMTDDQIRMSFQSQLDNIVTFARANFSFVQTFLAFCGHQSLVEEKARLEAELATATAKQARIDEINALLSS